MPQSVPAAPQSAQDFQGGQQTKIGQEFSARKLNTPLDKITRNATGKRSTTKTNRKRGRYIKALPMKGRPEDLAFDATLRAAAVHQRRRRAEVDAEALTAKAARPKVQGAEDKKQMAFLVRKPDLRKKLRVRRAANLILFVVDASWSMAVAERMMATKGAIMSLLTDAYQRRDRVGLVVFQKATATLVLPPTSSIDLAQRALRDIPVGGKTPLSAGLTLSLHVTQREKRLHPEVMPLMIVLTDGAGNVSMSNLPPQIEAHRIANQIRDEHIRSVVINMEHVAFDQGLARKLAEQMDARCLSLRELHAEALYEAVKKELK
jgi:magnesium chelatase subunit ChlD-like protein